jgi:SAM-dependent methyltransferase
MPFFETYFSGFDYVAHLRGKRVLDFGCFTGGRGVWWAEQYGIAKLFGTDINQIYIQAATEFAAARGIPCQYETLNKDGSIPFHDQEVDTVVSFDVFEHVDDLRRSLSECVRVLNPGGVMFVVFPSFYNPLESHLDLVTRAPGLQWLFSPKALTEAYKEIIEERGEGAYWYTPGNIAPWERLPTLNGTTAREFHRLIKEFPLKVLHETRTPIGVTGKRFRALRRLVIRPILRTALSTRIFDDLLLDRIAVVLKRHS